MFHSLNLLTNIKLKRVKWTIRVGNDVARTRFGCWWRTGIKRLGWRYCEKLYLTDTVQYYIADFFSTCFAPMFPPSLIMHVVPSSVPLARCLVLHLQILVKDTRWTQDVNWAYIRRSEDVLHVFWTSYVRLIYVLCLRGNCQRLLPILSENYELLTS